MAQERREVVVVRSRIVLIVMGVLCAAVAHAQTPMTGMLSGHIGVVHGGDTEKVGVAPAASVTVLESSGWGAEVELGHARRFAGDVFEESGITTLMVNALYMRPHPVVRPFGTAGVGLLRVRASIIDEQSVVNRTDWGFNGGGGVLVMLNDAVGVRADLRYFRYFQSHDDLPLTNNGFFDFWRTSIGATWSWPIR